MAMSRFFSFILVLAWWRTLKPENDRDWQPDVAQLARAEVDGDEVTLHSPQLRVSIRIRLHAGVGEANVRAPCFPWVKTVITLPIRGHSKKCEVSPNLRTMKLLASGTA